MTQERVEILFMPDGSVKIDAIGFSGNACEKATEQVHIVLGGTSDKKKKPEYYSGSSSIDAKQSIKW